MEALLADPGAAARALACALACRPNAVARMRAERPPKPALHAPVIRLAWDELAPAARKAGGLGPRPPRNLRWHAEDGRFASSHAFDIEPVVCDTLSLCGHRTTAAVLPAWSTEPDGVAALCPGFLARWRRIDTDSVADPSPR